MVPEPETKGTIGMSANFRGIKQLGDSASDGAVATWSFHGIAGVGSLGAPDIGPTTPTLPDQFGYHNQSFTQSYKWLLDINAVQATYGFGTIKKLRVQINKLRSWISGDNKWYISGRIWIYVPLTNELFCFSSATPLSFGALTGTPEDSPETYNEEFDVNIPVGAVIEVWCESDFNTGNFVTSPSPCVVINAYNRR
jgi:hypothetical protein